MNQTWKSYCEATSKTALYPQAGSGSSMELSYLTLGLIGEVGEVGEIGEFYEFVTDGLKGDHNEKMFAELGDCFWYVARLSLFLSKTGCKPIVPTLKDSILTLCMEGMGRLANSAKKIIRDRCAPDRFAANVQFVANDLATLYAMVMFKETPSEEAFWHSLDQHVLQPNLNKLYSRLERGTIQGDGDDR